MFFLKKANAMFITLIMFLVKIRNNGIKESENMPAVCHLSIAEFSNRSKQIDLLGLKWLFQKLTIQNKYRFLIRNNLKSWLKNQMVAIDILLCESLTYSFLCKRLVKKKSLKDIMMRSCVKQTLKKRYYQNQINYR